MNPTLKKILLAFVLILIAALLATFFILRGAPKPQTGTPVSNAPVQSSNTPPEQLEIPLAPITPAQTEAQKNRNMTAFSMQFTERYGSYSTEGNFQNLKDLLPSMTAAMRARTQATINAGVPAGSEFYGITTDALAVKVESATDVSARVVVSARRSEVKGSNPTRMFNQDARLELVKSGDEWLVDSVVWIVE